MLVFDLVVNSCSFSQLTEYFVRNQFSSLKFVQTAANVGYTQCVPRTYTHDNEHFWLRHEFIYFSCNNLITSTATKIVNFRNLQPSPW